MGAAGYTGGELIRLLVNHPEAEIVFANSESNAGNKVSDVHEGLLGDTSLCFTSEMPFDKVDVVFFCFGHGKSEEFLASHSIPEHVRIIDLAQDFRIAAPGAYDASKSMTPANHDFVYGLPELNREEIRKARHVANPGCFATCIQLALLPAAKMQLLQHDVAVNAITGSTGAKLIAIKPREASALIKVPITPFTLDLSAYATLYPIKITASTAAITIETTIFSINLLIYSDYTYHNTIFFVCKAQILRLEALIIHHRTVKSVRAYLNARTEVNRFEVFAPTKRAIADPDDTIR